MKGGWRSLATGLAALGLVVGLAVTAPLASSKSSAKSTINVGVIYCRTGPLADYGAEYIEGLRYGLKYVTNGTNKVNGHPLNITIEDETGTPATAVSEAKDLIGKGYKIIGGTASSGMIESSTRLSAAI